MNIEEPIKESISGPSQNNGRRILIVDACKSGWADYLRAFFEETSAEVTHSENADQASALLSRLKPDLCFLDPKISSLALIQKLKVRCETDASFHLFQIGDEKEGRPPLPYICHFDRSEQGLEFFHKFTNHLKLPERIRVLVADDDPEIRALVTEHLEKSKYPIFEVVCAEDGVEAIQKIKQENPDFALLDFSMPQKDGREVYAFIQSLGRQIPVIVYLDIFSGQQVMDLYQIGRPLIIDKGGECSSMVNLAAFIKKVFYFGKMAG